MQKGDQEKERSAFPQSQERPARAGGEGLGPLQAPGSSPAGRRERGPRRPTWVDEGLPAAPAWRERTGAGLAHGYAPRPRQAAGDPLRTPPPPPPPAPGAEIPGSGADVTEAGAGRGAEAALSPRAAAGPPGAQARGGSAAGGGSRDPRHGGAAGPGRLHPAAERRGDLPDVLLNLRRVINKNNRDPEQVYLVSYHLGPKSWVGGEYLYRFVNAGGELGGSARCKGGRHHLMSLCYKFHTISMFHRQTSIHGQFQTKLKVIAEYK